MCDARPSLPSPTPDAGKIGTGTGRARPTRRPRRAHIADTGSRPASGTRRDTAGSAPPSRSGSGTRSTSAESRVWPRSTTPSRITQHVEVAESTGSTGLVPLVNHPWRPTVTEDRLPTLLRSRPHVGCWRGRQTGGTTSPRPRYFALFQSRHAGCDRSAIPPPILTTFPEYDPIQFVGVRTAMTCRRPQRLGRRNGQDRRTRGRKTKRTRVSLCFQWVKLLTSS